MMFPSSRQRMQANTDHPAPADHSRDEEGHPPHAKATTAALALAALGVVFGDIGTSPLYALKDCVRHHGLGEKTFSETFILGSLSLIFWSLTLVVNVKYLLVVLRATNHGEGGIFSLLSLVPRSLSERPSREKVTLAMLAILGAGLLFGDGIITPSISVLSAVEGIQTLPGGSMAWIGKVIVPIALVILVGLFFVQQFGTGRIGIVFGPVMIVWFLVLAALGIWGIVQEPDVLRAVNPVWAFRLVADHPWHTFTLLGSVVLVTTGAEALYADIGHFGLKPIRMAWYLLALPSLVLNYFGQGAWTLSRINDGVLNGEGWNGFNPFFEVAPSWLRGPLVLLATAAAIIASQAMISGVFSIARQAMRMGYLPRLEVVHTSQSAEGQIYLPAVNLLMLVGCVITVLWFQSSDHLAAAYGIAVTATFAITTILVSFVARRLWRWSRWRVGLVMGPLLLIDLAFLSANLLKIGSGGWVAVLVGVSVATVMGTWMQGSYYVGRRMAEAAGNIHEFLASLWSEAVPRVPGTAVFLTTSSATPFSLAAFVEHSHVLHKQVILLSIQSAHMPVVPAKRQVRLEWMPDGFWKLTAQCGFMETPDVPKFLERAREHGLDWDPVSTTYFARRMVVLPTGDAPMTRWRKRLFAHLNANAVDSIRFFNLPPDRVVEFGVQMEL
jgi:KUP system potassium uptake protein